MAKKKKTGVWTTALLFAALLVGLVLLVYPSFADYYNALLRGEDISRYVDEVSGMDTEVYDRIWKEAIAYNEEISGRDNFFTLSDEEMERYSGVLSVSEDSPIGYIEVPSISVYLPIFHGTGDDVLVKAVGHLEWSNLPIGGEGTHSVLSGHRGLPTARLFTDLDQMVEGDIFILRVLDEIMTYEVDQIRIVEPYDTTDLLPVEGEDYCSLVTCTPYGINTHRLIIRGHRIENIEDESVLRITAEAVQIEPIIVAPVLAIPVLLLLILGVFLSGIGKKKKK